MDDLLSLEGRQDGTEPQQSMTASLTDQATCLVEYWATQMVQHYFQKTLTEEERQRMNDIFKRTSIGQWRITYPPFGRSQTSLLCV